MSKLALPERQEKEIVRSLMKTGEKVTQIHGLIPSAGSGIVAHCFLSICLQINTVSQVYLYSDPNMYQPVLLWDYSTVTVYWCFCKIWKELLNPESMNKPCSGEF